MAEQIKINRAKIEELNNESWGFRREKQLDESLTDFNFWPLISYATLGHKQEKRKPVFINNKRLGLVQFWALNCTSPLSLMANL